MNRWVASSWTSLFCLILVFHYAKRPFLHLIYGIYLSSHIFCVIFFYFLLIILFDSVYISMSIFFPWTKKYVLAQKCIYMTFLPSAPKVTANLYCICLSIPHIYRCICTAFWDTQYKSSNFQTSSHISVLKPLFFYFSGALFYIYFAPMDSLSLFYMQKGLSGILFMVTI